MKEMFRWFRYRALIIGLGSLSALTVNSSLALAQKQQAEDISDESKLEREIETIGQPIVAPSNEGLYNGINDLPENIRKSAPFAREYYELTRHVGPDGVWDVNAYLKAYEHAQEMQRVASVARKSASMPQAAEWTNLGISGTGPKIYSGGCTVAIVFDPKNPDIMYSGTSGGGVFKSLDGGATWVALTDNAIPNLSVSSVAIDPENTNTLYVGSGYGYNSQPTYSGTGMYKSDDGGSTWSRLTIPGAGNSIVKVLVHPTKPNIVFASSFDGGLGVYRSIDRGATWARVYPSASKTATAVVWDIIPGKVEGSSQTFYMVEGGAGTESGIYKSVNDGQTWTKLSSAALPSPGLMGRSVLASPAKAPDKVYCLMAKPSGDQLGMFKTTNGGTDWSAVDIPSSLFKVSDTADSWQGWYDIFVGITPNSTTHDTVYIGGVWAYVNYDDGQGWRVFSGYADVVRADGPHVDHHAIAFHPQNSSIVYNGNDGGIYMSRQAGYLDGSTNTWSYRSNGMISNRFYHIGLDKAGGETIVWGGAQDQGTWRLKRGSDANFQYGGDGFQPVISPQSQRTVWAENPNGSVSRTNDYTAGNWSTVASDGKMGDNAGWDAPLRMATGNVKIGSNVVSRPQLLLLGRQNIWRTADGGDNWTKLGISFAGGNYCTAIGLANWNPYLVYAAGNHGTAAKRFQVSTDFGATWTQRGANVGGSEISSIQTTSADTNMVIVSTRSYSTSAGRVLVSKDRGATWQNASGSGVNALPAVACESIALDSASPTTRWYAATDFGMYITNDGGQNWLFAGSGMGLVPCRDVQLYSNKTTLRVATFGRGIWENTDAPSIQGIQKGVQDITLKARSDARGATLTWEANGQSNAGSFILERSVNAEAFEPVISLTAGQTSYSHYDAANEHGTYLYQVRQIGADGTEKLSNRVELHFGVGGLYVQPSYPNPFVVGGTNLVTIRYELPSSDQVAIRIYSVSGRLVRQLLSDARRDAGLIEEQWDGRDEQGNVVSQGSYIYTIATSANGSVSGKLSIVRE